MPFETLEHDGYFELRFFGPLDESGWASRVGLMSGEMRFDRFLINFTDATKIDVPAHQFLRSAERAKGRDWRIAILAPQPAFFGLARQTVQMSGMGEGETVNVFRDRGQAVTWLTAA